MNIVTESTAAVKPVSDTPAFSIIEREDALRWAVCDQHGAVLSYHLHPEHAHNAVTFFSKSEAEAPKYVTPSETELLRSAASYLANVAAIDGTLNTHSTNVFSLSTPTGTIEVVVQACFVPKQC